ncbi:MAG: 16S rRNA (uracil(1498)-N(3))-methyltransferase [Deltaproteobacteria bacterium]|nr:16S rRNA (uracil(1498)-N(3))-methyltransferase [Deltaproteobacteria bacterium]
MSERRFYFAGLPDSGAVALSPDIVHHVAVLRLSAGAKIVLFDGAGKRADATLLDATHARIDRFEQTPPRAPLLLAVPLLKGDRQDWLVEKLCELGVSTLQPIVTERAVIRELSDNKRARMERLVVAACKQCGRADLMRIAPLADVASVRDATVLSPGAAVALAELSPSVLVVGPEGGLTDAEEVALVAAGGTRARLVGPILRAETAAIAAAAIALART